MSEIAQEFVGLTALLESTFPKKCMNCGRIYSSAQAFLQETQSISKTSSSLKEAMEDDGSVVVEVFRNCICGSTLMDEFSDRRDTSTKGLARRRKFDKVLRLITAKGMDQQIAHDELVKMLHGHKSPVLEAFLKKTQPDSSSS